MARLADQRASVTLLFLPSAGVRNVLHYGDPNSCSHTFASSTLTTERIPIRSCSEGSNLSNVFQLIRVLKQALKAARTLKKTHQSEQQFWHSNYGGRLFPQTNRHHPKMPILLLIFSEHLAVRTQTILHFKAESKLLRRLGTGKTSQENEGGVEEGEEPVF